MVCNLRAPSVKKTYTDWGLISTHALLSVSETPPKMLQKKMHLRTANAELLDWSNIGTGKKSFLEPTGYVVRDALLL